MAAQMNDHPGKDLTMPKVTTGHILEIRMATKSTSYSGETNRGNVDFQITQQSAHAPRSRCTPTISSEILATV